MLQVRVYSINNNMMIIKRTDDLVKYGVNDTMKKIVKLFVYILIGIALTVILPFTVLFALNGNTDFADMIEANWDIILSNDSGWKEIYETNEGASFHGDGIRYTVIVYNEKETISNMVKWTKQEGPTRRHNTYRESANAWLQEISADKAQYPQYDACQYYYQQKSDGSELIMFWHVEQKKVYVAESFY